MLRTITLGSCVSVQGLVVGQRPDGKLVVRVDEREFVGRPVTAFRPPPPAPPARPSAIAAATAVTTATA